MPVVHIRVVEVKCNETKNKINYFFVNFYTNSKPSNVEKLSIDIAQKNSKVMSSCSKSITLDVDNYGQNQLYVQLKRHRMIISDDDVGKVVIPLKWFPRRKVVREWFPLTSAGKLKKTLMDNINEISNTQTKNANNNKNETPELNDGSENLMLLLDIHIAKKKDKPFIAPFSSMKVLPSWKKPLLLQGSEFPPVPPIAYIVGHTPNASSDDSIPPHQSYVVMMQPGQQNQNVNNANYISNAPNSNASNINTNNNNINNNININTNNINANRNNNNINSNNNQIQQQAPASSLNSQQPESHTQSELQPYFPAPQPNTHPPADNIVLPPFMQGNAEGMNVTVVTEYMSPYSNPNNMNEIFATDDIPNVYYPQVNIISEVDNDDDDDDDDDDDADNDGKQDVEEEEEENDDDLKDN